MVGSILDGSTTKDIFGGPTHFRVLVLVCLGRPVDQKCATFVWVRGAPSGPMHLYYFPSRPGCLDKVSPVRFCHVFVQ
jgi:hypothetical protein